MHGLLILCVILGIYHDVLKFLEHTSLFSPKIMEDSIAWRKVLTLPYVFGILGLVAGGHAQGFLLVSTTITLGMIQKQHDKDPLPWFPLYEKADSVVSIFILLSLLF